MIESEALKKQKGKTTFDDRCKNEYKPKATTKLT